LQSLAALRQLGFRPVGEFASADNFVQVRFCAVEQFVALASIAEVRVTVDLRAISPPAALSASASPSRLACASRRMSATTAAYVSSLISSGMIDGEATLRTAVKAATVRG